MKTAKIFLMILGATLLVQSCCKQQPSFVKVEDGQFVLDGKPHRFVGTNFWYGAILASEGTGSDRARLAAELDSLHTLGLDNLRVLVGGDGPDGVFSRIEPTLQKTPGVYNDTILRGLDYLLAEMGKRDMKAVLYLNNAWEWSGGYGQYLEWAGVLKPCIPLVDGYELFCNQMAEYSRHPEAQELFENHIRYIVSRRNTVTGRLYRDDPAIFAWEISNEPRVFAKDSLTQAMYVGWLHRAAGIFKSCDPNHMVTTGSEGIFGCENDSTLCCRVHDCADIDYITAHIWPYNWSWVSHSSPQDDIANAIANTGDYLRSHSSMGAALGKPVVVEEFGFPRDDMQLSKAASTTGRDAYYSFIFDCVCGDDPAFAGIAGCNFWGWGGFAASPDGHSMWMRGDDYCGDPAQEDQGLNSVYASDTSTLAIIKSHTSKYEN